MTAPRRSLPERIFIGLCLLCLLAFMIVAVLHG
jgi:hypothetical protein